MPSLSDLFVKVGWDTSGWTKGLQDISGDLKGLNQEIGGLERAFGGFEKIGDRMTEAGTAISIGITAPVGLATAAVLGLSGTFELEMGKVSSLMANVTNNEMKGLHDGVLGLASSMGIDAVQGANALYEAISAGVPKENAIDFLAVASQAAIAGVTNTATAVDGLTSVLNAYHLPATKAKEISDQMFQAVNVGKFTFDQLASSISIATPIASQLGVSFSEVVASAATLTSQGFSVSEAMTSVRAAMVAILTPNKDMNALIAQTGYESGLALIKALGFQGALNAINTAAGGNVAVLAEAYGRVEAMGSALGLTGANALVAAGHLNTVTNSAGATQQAFDKITGTNAQQWDMLKNRIEAVAIEFGVALAPAVQSVLSVGTTLVNDFLSPAVKWFTELPAPVQAAAFGMTALAAAAGPVLIVLGSLVSSVTTLAPLFISLTTTTTAAGAAAGTAAGAAGLGALASVLPIVAAAVAGLAVAWAGWTFQDSIPGLIVLKSLINLLHTEYSTLLSIVRGGISAFKDTEQPTIDVTKALDDMNKKAKPLHEQLGVVVKQSKDLKNEFPKLAKETKNQKDEIQELKKQTGLLHPKNEELAAMLRILQSEHNKATSEVAAYKLKVMQGKVETIDFSKVLDDLNDIVRGTYSEIRDVSEIAMPPFIKRLNDLKPPTDSFREALKQLGITGSADLQKVADEAGKARDVVLGSNEATDFEKKTAIYKALKAQVEAAIEMGQKVPKETQDALAKMEAELNTGKGQSVVNATRGLMTQVSTVVTNFAQDAAKALFDGDLSFGEKLKKLWGDLRTALVSTFIEPATKALTDFISGVLTDLISGKGFGGVLGQIQTIGRELKDVFGAGGVAAPSPTPTTAPGGGGGAAGAAASAASGALGIVSAIGSVATAVSSIIGNFQMAGMNKSLDLIEHSTRYSESHLLQLVEKAQNIFLAELPNIRFLMAQFVNDHAWRIHDVWEQAVKINDGLMNVTNAYLDRIAVATEFSASQLQTVGGAGVTVNIYSPNFTNKAGVDDAISQIKRNLR